MELEWNDDKRLEVLARRGLDLLEVARMFRGPVLTTKDERSHYGEVRWRSIGVVDGVCYILVHTERAGSIRLITAWKAGRRAAAQYQASLAGRDRGDEAEG